VGSVLLSFIGGISNFGGGSSGGGGKRVNPNAIVLTQLEQALAAGADFGDALNRGNERDMKKATIEFGVVEISACSPEFQTIHKAHWEVMIVAMEARISRTGNRDFDRDYSEKKARVFVDSANQYLKAWEREVARLESGGR
jgi:hypothetical protein